MVSCHNYQLAAQYHKTKHMHTCLIMRLGRGGKCLLKCNSCLTRDQIRDKNQWQFPLLPTPPVLWHYSSYSVNKPHFTKYPTRIESMLSMSPSTEGTAFCLQKIWRDQFQVRNQKYSDRSIYATCLKMNLSWISEKTCPSVLMYI